MKKLQPQRNGTRMTRIGRISTDTHYPCVSASSAQSVFYRKTAIFDDDNKPQMNADEIRYFHASNFNKIIHCKGRKERKAHQMISFGIQKTTEGGTGGRMPRADMEKLKKIKVPLPSNSNTSAAELEHKMAELEKARQAAESQIEAIEALPGAILREVFDFEEENTGSWNYA